MPASCRGRYRRIGLLEVEDGVEFVAMISERARGVLRIVKTWEKLSVGRTMKSAYGRALAEATRLADALNLPRPWTLAQYRAALEAQVEIGDREEAAAAQEWAVHQDVALEQGAA